MIQSLKTIKNRIRSIENTKKVTAAMEMVSVAKLNRIEKSLFLLRPYVLGLKELMQNLINSQPGITHALLEAGPLTEKIALCLITSDSGLCGTYNNNILRLAEEFINTHGREKIKLVCIGRKGFNYFKQKGLEVLNTYIGLNGRYSAETLNEISANLVNIFTLREAAQVYVAYTCFKTALFQKPLIEKFLNLERPAQEEREYILEPDSQTILNEIIPKYISMKLRLIILESFTAEHSARIVAMKTATDNAKELLEDLILFRNKVRQANITQELMEIISSSEALRG